MSVLRHSVAQMLPGQIGLHVYGLTSRNKANPSLDVSLGESGQFGALFSVFCPVVFSQNQLSLPAKAAGNSSTGTGTGRFLVADSLLFTVANTSIRLISTLI